MDAENYHQKSKEELILLLQSQSKQIKFLEEQIQAYQLRQFANKSEKINSQQLSFFDEAELPKNPDALLAQEEKLQIASYERKKSPGRKALPVELPRVPRIYDLQESEKICVCGYTLTHIKDEKSEQLEIVPAKIYVIEHIRKKYACRNCEETIKTAPMPILPIPRSIAASGLLSHVLVSKFQDHLPLFRQEQILRRIGVELSRSTLSLWVIKCGDLIIPLVNCLQDRLLTHDVAYADETTTQVLKERSKPVQSKKYMWLFAGGPPEEFVYYYHYHPSRSHEVVLEFLADFKGFLHCDGYAAYDTLAAKNKAVTLVGCLYHARRKFVEVTKILKGKEGVATQILHWITQLAQIEERIKTESAGEKYRLRQNQAKPILTQLHDYLLKNSPAIPPKSLLGQAVSYTLNQWPKILNYLADGRLEISNNRSERAIKPFVMGRKGWLFADSVAGAHAAARIYSLIETCKHHHVEPYDYLRYVFQAIPQCQTVEDFEALLPYNIDKKLLNTQVV